MRRERFPNFRGKVEACGTVHTAEGWERRKQRDTARQRARLEVKQHHFAEFHDLLAADDDPRYGRKYARTLRLIAGRYPEQYEWFYEHHLSLLGYESQPCSSSSTRLRSDHETSGTGAAVTARSLPEPGEGSEMADRTRSNMTSGSR